MLLAGLILVIAVALCFDFTNGFHDAANAVAAVVSTRALSLRAALTLAAVMNLLGALLGTKVAATVTAGIIAAPTGAAGLGLVFCAVAGAIVWNVVTWYFALPSSSSHALIGGMVGAALAASGTVYWSGVLAKVVVPMMVSPLIGLGLGYLLMLGVLWLFRNARFHPLGRGFRRAQIFSAASLGLGHGLQDAQKTMGLIVLALVVTGHQHGTQVPLWTILCCALAMAAGTYTGGRRIIATMGRKIFPLTPPYGFVAELTGSLVLYLTAYVFAAPTSTTHVVTSAVMGVGATRRKSAVRWAVAENILVSWVLTLPAAAITAALLYLPLHLIWT